MTITRFPDPETADSSGLLALGGDLEPESLLLAYRSGIFPWPIEDCPLAWFSPPRRGILEFARLHIPRSLAKTLKKAAFTLTIDQSFEAVIRACAETHGRGKGAGAGEPGTWITPEMITAYCELHRLGHAHSVEAWRERELVGGIYGVDCGGAFAAESMFHRESGASMAALLHLCTHLESRGAEWIDIQMVTPHMKIMGARAIPRARFLRRLGEALETRIRLF